MGFLLAKILILLVAAAAAGALFAYWWFRRSYEDVTLEYTRSRDEWTSWRRSFEERLAARPEVDLQPLTEQVAGMDAAVRAINIPQPKAPDLTPVLNAVSGLRMPTPDKVDLAPVHARLDAIEQRIGSIRMPDAAAPVDLEPLAQRLAALEERLAGISIPQPQDVDLNPALQRLTAIDTAVRAIRIPDAREPDLSAITATLQQLQTRVDAIRIPDAPAPVDLNPVLERLSLLQTRFENPPAPPAPTVGVREGSKNLLSHAGHGRPDDLKQIKGVKRVLERTLHKVGVYYFWQIAEWSPEDVKHVDSVLPAFKGRIERDDWVTQASELSSKPTAAKPPGHSEH
jgi:predicted flap endonuclease-1-like 5' DNA nuclease